MKKVLTAALLCAVSSFAAWDYFPVIENGKGEAKLEFSSSRQAYDASGDFGFKIRYSPLENLEIMSKFEGLGTISGEGNHIIGARYQIIPMLSAGVDIGLPIPAPVWNFTPSIQFSMPFSEALVLGSNVAFTIPMENAETEYTDFMSLSAGIELDFTIGQSMLWVAFDIETGIGEDSADNKAKDAGRGLGFTPAVGYVASIGSLSLGTSVAFSLGEDAGNDPVRTTIGIDASVKF